MSYSRYLKSRTTLLVVCYLLVVCFILPYACRSLPFSYYYDTSLDSHEFILSKNDMRTLQAQTFLRNVSFEFPQVSKPEFCMVVITARRHKELFTLTQVVASLAPQVASSSDIVFAVYNSEGDEHTEALEIARKVQVITQAKLSQKIRNFDKQRTDYIFALEWCLQQNSQFTVVFEDDALPPTDFVYRLKFVLNYRMDKHSRNWAMLKLFYPEKYEGWSNDFHIIVELVLATGFGGALLTAISLCVLPLSSYKVLMVVLRLVASLLFILLLLVSVGRPHWLALRSLSTHLSAVVSAPGCCIPAVVYPSAHLPELLDFLQAQHCSAGYPLDIALDSFASARRLQSLLVVPNMVAHIGFVSSLPGKGWKKGQAQV